MTDSIIATPAATPSTAMPLANISTATLVAAMQSSFTSAKFALQQEIGVGLAVYASTGRVDADSKKKLRDIYIASGWAASSPTDVDYKTTLRRCQIISVLYVHLGRDVVSSWISGLAEGMVINTIIQNIAPLALYSMDSVLAHCGKQRAVPKAKLPEPVAAPQTAVPTEERRAPAVTPAGGLPEGAHGPLQPETMYRRASDRGAEEPMEDAEAHRYQNWLAIRGGYPVADTQMLAEGYKQIKTEHVAVTLSQNTTKDEILRAVFELMQLANALTGIETVGDIKEEIDGVVDVPPAEAVKEPSRTLEEVIAEFQEKEKAKALEATKVSVEPDDEDLEEMARHQAIEAARLEAEAIAAKKTPIAPQAASRYRKGTTPTKAK